MVEIPQDIAQDAAQAAIWSELVADDSRFTEQDVPALRLLCFWHAVAMEALEDIHPRGWRSPSGSPLGVFFAR